MHTVKGDLFKYLQKEIEDGTVEESPIIVIHCCNDIGAWGKGFVVSLSKFNREPEIAYRAWYKKRRELITGTSRYVLPLGVAQVVPILDEKGKRNVVVSNIIGQHDIYNKNGMPPVRVKAIQSGVIDTIQCGWIDITRRKWRIWMPLIGSGLAGGRWEEIKRAIMEALNTFEEVYRPDPTVFILE